MSMQFPNGSYTNMPAGQRGGQQGGQPYNAPSKPVQFAAALPVQMQVDPNDSTSMINMADWARKSRGGNGRQQGSPFGQPQGGGSPFGQPAYGGGQQGGYPSGGQPQQGNQSGGQSPYGGQQGGYQGNAPRKPDQFAPMLPVIHAPNPDGSGGTINVADWANKFRGGNGRPQGSPFGQPSYGGGQQGGYPSGGQPQGNQPRTAGGFGQVPRGYGGYYGNSGNARPIGT